MANPNLSGDFAHCALMVGGRRVHPGMFGLRRGCRTSFLLSARNRPKREERNNAAGDRTWLREVETSSFSRFRRISVRAPQMEIRHDNIRAPVSPLFAR